MVLRTVPVFLCESGDSGRQEDKREERLGKQREENKAAERNKQKADAIGRLKRQISIMYQARTTHRRAESLSTTASLFICLETSHPCLNSVPS